MIGIFHSSFTRKKIKHVYQLLRKRTPDLSGKSVRVLEGELNKPRRFLLSNLLISSISDAMYLKQKSNFVQVKSSSHLSISPNNVTAASQTAKTKNCKKLKIEVDLWKIYFFHGNFYLGRLIIWDVSSHLAGLGHLQATTI